MTVAEGGHTGGGDAGRSVGRQIRLLFRKNISLKRRALGWTLLEVFFPLQPVFFLWLTFTLGKGFVPYVQEHSPAVSAGPAVPLLNTSALGLLGALHLGGNLGFAPAAGASPAPARAVHALLCGAYDAMLASPVYAERLAQAEAQLGGMAASACATDAMSLECRVLSSAGHTAPGRCLLFDSRAQLDAAGGWLPFVAEAGKAGIGAAKVSGPSALYAGVEVGARRLLLRHEALLLADDASAEPEEQNTLRSGLLVLQAAASGALLLHQACPRQTRACDARCVASLLKLLSSAGLEQQCGSVVDGGAPSAACARAVSAQVLWLAPAPRDLVLQYALPLAASASTPAEAPGSGSVGVAASLRLLDPRSLFMAQFPVAASSKLINWRKYMYPFMFLSVLFLNTQARPAEPE